ncbi:MAG TPA: DEAD/DEAH box helicase [Xanthobacteraceae bacterium]|jgi:superfamily II DNA or RNA helicase
MLEAADSKRGGARTARTGAGGRRSTHKARNVLDRPAVLGWRTTDEDEIALRRWRGRTEIVAIAALEPEHSAFGTYRAQSGSGNFYEVEIRSLAEPRNSCGCIDHRVNGLGTCKHIEGVIEALRRRGAGALREAGRRGSPRVEIFVDRAGGATPKLAWPAGNARGMREAREWLAPFILPDGSLTPEADAIEALISAWRTAPASIRRRIRVSRHFTPWLERVQRQSSREQARAGFLAEVEAGTASFDLLHYPLLPYQREGMLHLAFAERALLADEMGLGKTVQAIAACELLARRKGIERVLVVCPTSLKAEWEEQIARFAAREARPVFGLRPARLAAYREPAFFTIVNYEQVWNDARDLNEILRPDIIVLDEAQRIKNWQTKTARQVKSLRSPYAFVLTGTPVENRIDELYSIVQYLDPELVGPLFRFNRDFYELDERGRPVDYQNLSQLRGRLQGVMLRRRKSDVESELPGRTVKSFLVPMTEEQRLRYEDYHEPAARLIAQAQRRPLRQEEFERLMMLLGCMRMVCDTPAILDPSCRISPKLEELEGILGDLLEDPERKIIVFSEWERMLALVRELAIEMGVETAWHTGSVPQQRRRAEIMRFKQDPACRLFLSTDSGSVGLNLQVASAVVNVDLPWNPAKLEQRIARAWRKNQTRSVTVVNLVCEDSIEHQILHLLGQKQALADGVLDGQGDLAALKMPSGRAAMIERMQALMQTRVPRIVSAEEALAAELRQRYGERALLIEARAAADGRMRILAVLDVDGDTLAAETRRHEIRGDTAPAVEVIDKPTWLTMRRLAAGGIITMAESQACVFHQAPELAGSGESSSDAPARVGALRAQAERALGMARALSGGGFSDEAFPLVAKAIAAGAAARLAALGELAVGATLASPMQVHDLVERGALMPQAETALSALWSAASGKAVVDLASAIETGARVIATLGDADVAKAA